MAALDTYTEPVDSHTRVQGIAEDRGLIEIDVYGELIDECGRLFVGLQVGHDENEARSIDAVLPERGQRYFLVADVDPRR